MKKRNLAPIAMLVAVGATAAGAAAHVSKAPPPMPANMKAVLKQVAGLKVQARDAKLAGLAAKEGQVNWYTTLSSTALKQLTAAWSQAYPNVKLNVYRASSEDVTAKLLGEESSGTPGADIVEVNGATMLILQHKKNILVPYRGSPFAVQIPKKYRFDTWTADHLEEYVVAWNTKLVSDPPKSFQDLADPRWKGKIAVEPTDVDWFAALYTYFTTQAKPKLSPAAADRLFKGIVANAQLINGHTTQANLLAAGQVQVVVTEHAQPAEQLQAKGAPIAFTPFVTPVVERPQGLGLAYNLPHPAAALLFYDWILSPAGQKVMQATGTQPANPYYFDTAFSSKPQKVEMDMRPIVSHWQQWEKKYSSITGQPAG